MSVLDIDVNFPRKLTALEINEIAEVLPPLNASTKKVGEVARNEIVKVLKEVLHKIVITPLAIPLLKENITNKYNESVIEKGTTVGFHAGEAFGQQVQQATLNAVHMIGLYDEKKILPKRISELTRATKTPKAPTMEIHFKDYNLSYEDIFYNKRIDIVYMTLGKLVEGHELDIPSNIFSDCIDNDIKNNSDKSQLNEPYWYEIYKILYSDFNIKTNATRMVRLKMKKEVMYDYKISLMDIANIINNENIFKVKCIPSPANIGYLDIFPLEDSIVSLNNNINYSKDDEMLSFLQESFLKKINYIYIKGIEGINLLVPKSKNVWNEMFKNEEILSLSFKDGERISSFLKDGERISIDSKDKEMIKENIWKIYLDVRYKYTGIPMEKLFLLLKELDVELVPLMEQAQNKGVELIHIKGQDDYVNKEEKFFMVKMPNSKSPNEYIKELIQKDEKDEKDYEAKQKLNNEKIHKRKPTDLSKLYNYYYAVTEGSNLVDLFTRSDINKYTTISNNPVEMGNIFGKEAGRVSMLNEFFKLFNFSYENSTFNIRHLMLIVDFMTSNGGFKQMSYDGLKLGNKSYLSKASYQRQMDILEKAAAKGTSDKNLEISSSIYFGKKALIGKNAFETPEEKREKIEKAKRERKILESENFNISADITNTLDDFLAGFNDDNIFNTEEEDVDDLDFGGDIDLNKDIEFGEDDENKDKRAPLTSEELQFINERDTTDLTILRPTPSNALIYLNDNLNISDKCEIRRGKGKSRIIDDLTKSSNSDDLVISTNSYDLVISANNKLLQESSRIEDLTQEAPKTKKPSKKKSEKKVVITKLPDLDISLEINPEQETICVPKTVVKGGVQKVDIDDDSD